jgi:AAA domain
MSEPLRGHYGLNLIVYGPSKVGKSYLGDTSPTPRLVLDAEAGSRFTPSRKTYWDPVTQRPPEVNGEWDTVIVAVRSYRDVLKAYEWLASGQHPFRSVVLDSISEIQQRAVDDIAGLNQMQTQDWGKLLRALSDLIRKFRDLVAHPTRPLDAIVVIAMARQIDGVWKPFMQGQIATLMPYYVDICSYLGVVPLEDGTLVRRLFVGTFPGFDTGERVGGRLGTYVDEPNISEMLARIRGERPLPVTSSVTSIPVVTPVEGERPVGTLNLIQEG